MEENYATLKEIRRLPELLGRLGEYHPIPFTKQRTYAIVGCGSSYHLGLITSEIAEELGYRFGAYTSGSVLVSDTVRRRLSKADTVVLISRTGTTTETVRVAEMLRGTAETVGICCAESSPLTQLTNLSFNFDFMAEESVVMTSSFSAILAFLLYSIAELRDGVVNLLNAPERIRDELHRFEQLVARLDLRKKDHFVFLGYGPNLHLAREAALKVQELCLSRTEYNEPLEYRHGPVSTLSERSHVVLLGPLGRLEEELAEELEAKGASVEKLEPPEGDVLLGTLVAPAYAQYLGYAKAVTSGLDPDRPRGLVKSVQLKL